MDRWFLLQASALEWPLDNGLLGLMVVAGVAPVLDPGRDVRLAGLDLDCELGCRTTLT